MRQHGHLFYDCCAHRCRFRPPDDAESPIQQRAQLASSVLTHRLFCSREHGRQRTDHTGQPTAQTVTGLLRVELDGQERLPQNRDRLRNIACKFDETLDTLSPSGLARLLERRRRSEHFGAPGRRHHTPRLCRIQPVVDVRQFVQTGQWSDNGACHERPDGFPDRRRRRGGTLQRGHREQSLHVFAVIPCRVGQPFEPAPQRFGAHGLVKLLGFDEIDEGRAPGWCIPGVGEPGQQF